MNNDIFENLIDSDKLRVVQQGLKSPAPQLNTSVGTTSIGDKLRNSLDFIINNKKMPHGVIGTMLLAASALIFSNIKPSEPITITNDKPTVNSIADSATAEVSTNTINSTSLLDSLKNKITTAASIDNNAQNFPLLKTSHGRYSISPELQTSIEDAAKFSVPAGYKENQISRHVSQVKFKSAMEKGTPQDFLSALMSEGEGFRGNLYRDNKGLAYGIGWNVSMQNKDFNKFLMSAVNSNPQAIEQIVALSSTPIAYPPGKYGTEQTVMPVQRHLQASLLIADTFKNEGVYKGIEKQLRSYPEAKKNFKDGLSYTEQAKKLFASLDPNIQGALIYHSYKVGSAGYGKYTTLNQKVVDYGLTPINNRTIEQRREIAESISYTYTLNGQKIRDTAAEIKVASMISNPYGFGSLIKSNPAPKTMFQDVPQLSKNNVVTPKAGEDLIIPDPIGELKKAALEKGELLDFKLKFEYSDMNNGAVDPKAAAPARRRGLPNHF